MRRFGAPAPNVPYLRNYYKSEKLTRALAGYLETLLAADRYDIVHAQHVMTTVAAIDAAHAAHVPAVATVRVNAKMLAELLTVALAYCEDDSNAVTLELREPTMRRCFVCF